MSDKELLTKWMIEHSFATGHGDTLEDLLKELSWQVRAAQPADGALREIEIRIDEAEKWECLAHPHKSGNDEPGHFEPDCFACERLAELRALAAQKEEHA